MNLGDPVPEMRLVLLTLTVRPQGWPSRDVGELCGHGPRINASRSASSRRSSGGPMHHASNVK